MLHASVAHLEGFIINGHRGGSVETGRTTNPLF
jgi:hypothetical protein